MIRWISSKPSPPPQRWQSREEIVKAHLDGLAPDELRRVRPDYYWFRFGQAAAIRASRKYDPNQPRVPAGNPDGGQWTSEGGGAVGRLIQLAARRISPAREAECEEIRRRDEIQCRFVGLRACWSQAYLRYGNCLAGLPIPPLNY